MKKHVETILWIINILGLYFFWNYADYIVRFIIIMLYFKISGINIKKYFKPSKINIFLICKLLLFILAIDRLCYLYSFIPHDIKYAFVFFKNNFQTIVFQDIFYKYNSDIYQLILTISLTPLFEEIFYRGYLYNGLKLTYSNRNAAIIISGMIFGIYHIPRYGYDFGIIILVLLGIALAHCYEKTGTIWTPIIMHSLYNILINFGKLLTMPFYIILMFTYIILGGIVGTVELIKYLKRRKTFNDIQSYSPS
ncbi:CPBP family intramembrane glutamic endopeptidase [Treponema pedis]|uniref:CPBP family intramembrane metalloprotease n=1 Tax=Treponema pedis TaxID=409322 RepID=A0A7S6WRA5_9SPIR|nr:type II CAAX endopeptidase family protein [Treponema pedis]QOW61893.1 CPBP family intramembrane metalloprotease [Treponema pedis]